MPRYYMAKPVLGKSERSDWFFLGRDFAKRTVSIKTVQAVYFFSKAGHSNLQLNLRKENVYSQSSQRNYRTD